MEKLKLTLKKETITNLSDDQMKKFIGGKRDLVISGSSSCNNDSCNSQANTGSCDNHSCSCD